MKPEPMRSSLAHAVAAAVALFAMASGAALRAEPGDRDGSDREERSDAGERAERAQERAQERAGRDEGRDSGREDSDRDRDRATREDTRVTEERTDILADASEDAGSDMARQQEDLAKAGEDAAQDAEDRAEDLAEELAKADEDAADDAEDRAEDAADEAEDAAEDAADDADDMDEWGSSAEMQRIADDEAPEFDDRGFPVRRGEVVALNLSEGGLAAMQQRGFRVIAHDLLPSLGSSVTRLAVPASMDAGQALAQARRIEPQGTFDYTHYYRMQFNTAGTIATGQPARMPRRQGNLTVGMIDTGVIGHAALRGTRIDIQDFGQGSSIVPTAHGTAVASILASEGSARLFVANVFRGAGGGRDPYTSADALVKALEWLVQNKVPVVNMSLAGPRNLILDRLIEQAVGRGTIIVAAAGNGGPTAPPAYPAALRPVVAVTAVDQRNRVYRYANQGRYITVAAAGVDEPAANSAGGIALYSGTSFATPHVAAWMARCLQRATAAQCARQLRTSATDLGEPGFDPVYGHGLIR